MEIKSKITGLNHEGRGIAHINGKITFIENALPDEIIAIEITHKNSRFNQAKVIKVIQSSADRIIPKCQHFDICGGCQLQHVSQTYQIKLKQNNLLEQLKFTANIKDIQHIQLLEPLISIPWEYRYKARLSVKYVEKKQKLLIGFHEKNGRYIADMTRCEVLHPKIGSNIESLREAISSLNPQSYKHIPQIEIACDDNHCVLIIRHLVDLSDSDKIILQNYGEKHQFDIYLQPDKPKPMIRIFPNNEKHPEDQLASNLSYTINHINIQFEPGDFTQINPVINHKMVNLAISLLELTEKDDVLDLFCGLGNFSLPIARNCHSVTGIEGDSAMVTRAKLNAQNNQLPNTYFYTANLFEPDKDWPWLHQSYSKIVLDPPRTGAIEILPYIAKMNPKIILYISCNPSTLARDAGEFVHKYGYQLKKLAIIDMFPQTKHIESLAVFIK